MNKKFIRPAVRIAAAIAAMDARRKERGEDPVWPEAEMRKLKALGSRLVVLEGDTTDAPAGEIWLRVTMLDGTEI